MAVTAEILIKSSVIFCAVFLCPSYSGQPAGLHFQESGKEWCKCRRTEVGKRGNERRHEILCDHSRREKPSADAASGLIPDGAEAQRRKQRHTDTGEESDGGAGLFHRAEDDVLHRQAACAADRKPGGQEC